MTTDWNPSGLAPYVIRNRYGAVSRAYSELIDGGTIFDDPFGYKSPTLVERVTADIRHLLRMADNIATNEGMEVDELVLENAVVKIAEELEGEDPLHRQVFLAIFKEIKSQWITPALSEQRVEWTPQGEWLATNASDLSTLKLTLRGPVPKGEWTAIRGNEQLEGRISGGLISPDGHFMTDLYESMETDPDWDTPHYHISVSMLTQRVGRGSIEGWDTDKDTVYFIRPDFQWLGRETPVDLEERRTSSTSSPPADEDAIWYYGRGGEREGPLTNETLLSLIRSGEITGDSYIWSPLTEEWLIASNCIAVPQWILRHKTWESKPQPCDICRLGREKKFGRTGKIDWDFNAHGLTATYWLCRRCASRITALGLVQHAPSTGMAALIARGEVERPAPLAYYVHPSWLAYWKHGLELAGTNLPSNEFTPIVIRKFEQELIDKFSE